MSATTMGGLIGGVIDKASGGSAAGGAVKGALVANALKLVLPLVATFAVGWVVVRGAEALAGRGKGDAA